jgi:hypothetical protein
MPKLKVGDDELNVSELEDAEYGEGGGDFESYSGEQPPKGTMLNGYVKMWWTYTKNDDPMLKVLFVADGNKGDAAEYDGLPVWENAALTPGVKFRWAPLLNTFGLTIRDVKTKTVVADDDDNVGAPIEKIAGVAFGPDSDQSYCRIVTGREKYNGDWTTRVGRWLEWAEPEDADEDEEGLPIEPEPPKATRGRRAVAKAEEEEAAPKAARGARRKPAAKEEPPTRGRGRRAGGAKGGEADDDPPF